MDRGIPKVPLAEVHVHATVAPEYHTLRFQQFPLFLPVRHGPALAVNHPVARKMKLRTGVFQNMPYQPGMVRVTGKPGNLSVCHHLPTMAYTSFLNDWISIISLALTVKYRVNIRLYLYLCPDWIEIEVYA